MVTAITGVLRILLILSACLPLLAVAQGQESRVAFIELSASHDELYVQQQLLLTVRLYYSNQVIRGQLEDPEHPDAVIEPLGEQKQYQEVLDGEPYRVVERRYVIFPQKPGRLQLPPVDFQGTARHPRGHHYRVADSAVLFALQVRDIPDGFSGRTWLPASDLKLEAEGIEGRGPVSPGADLTRTLTLTARGLPATTLPELEHDYPDAVRSYPEPEQRRSSATEEGIEGRLRQTVALVPVPGNNGEVVLPEVRIPWWDVDEDREKVAVLPERTIELSGPVSRNGQPGDGSREPDTGSSPEGSGERQPATAPGSHWVWPLVAALLALGWLVTAVVWWLQAGQAARRPAVTRRGTASEREGFVQVCHQADALAPDFFSRFPAWVSLLTGCPCTTTNEALRLLDNRQLDQAVSQWQEHLFRDSDKPAPDGAALVQALKTARKARLERRKHSGCNSPDLPGLYPNGLNP
ncbi:MAG: protein BatD [Marinobacter sp.]